MEVQQGSSFEVAGGSSQREVQGQKRPMPMLLIGVGAVVVLGVVVGVIYLMMPFKCTESQQATCTKCRSKDTCSECIEQHAVQEGKCVFQCLETQKAEQCIGCSDNKTCTDCLSGYKVNASSKCEFQCVSYQDIKKCTKCTSDKVCTACEDGHVLETLENIGVTCKYVCNEKQKQDFCVECQDPATCLTCQDTHELVDGECVFACTDKQKADGCERCRDDKTCTRCQAGYQPFLSQCLGDSLHEAGGCNPAPEGGQYYTYRATDHTNYPPNGINTASAGGVMRYVHEEVVGIDCCAPVPQCVRKYNIDRIRRYKVTMRNVGDARKFRNFVQFDKGQCTLGGCVDSYKRDGYNVGCQIQNVEHFHYKDAAWMSYPGKCVSRQFSQKDDGCNAAEPGGDCPNPNGGKTCTYHLEEAGEVFLDELVGIGPPGSFKEWCKKGGREFVLHPETWRGDQPNLDFWKERKNVERNALRTKALVKAFRDKYPDTPQLPGCGER